MVGLCEEYLPKQTLNEIISVEWWLGQWQSCDKQYVIHAAILGLCCSQMELSVIYITMATVRVYMSTLPSLN